MLYVFSTCLAIVSFVVGAWIGAEAAFTAAFETNASVAAQQLRLIESGKIDLLRTLLETDVDAGLMVYVQRKGNPLKSLYPELQGQSDSILDALSYRSKHPMEAPSDALLQELGEHAESYIRDHKRVLDLIERYDQQAYNK